MKLNVWDEPAVADIVPQGAFVGCHTAIRVPDCRALGIGAEVAWKGVEIQQRRDVARIG
jgi:hypothetical protein